MKKFMMVAAAIVGISMLGVAGTAQAGPGWGSGYGGHNYGHNYGYGNGYGYNAGYRGYSPVRPIYAPPIYRPVPVAPVYGGYPAYGYGYGAPGFGVSTPGFGLYIR